MVSVGPHDFKPLRRFFNRGRCRACHADRGRHPVNAYSRARPLGDKSLPYDVKLSDRP
jgi:hypothetical protein